MDVSDTGGERNEKEPGKRPVMWAFAFGFAALLSLGAALPALFWLRQPAAGIACLAASSLCWGLCTWMALRHLSRGARPR
jgi:hypothetical protein